MDRTVSHTAEPRPRPPVGLYLHVPFCISLCPYCDFVVVSGRAAVGPGNRIEELLAALHVELDLRADALDTAFPSRPPLRSVYLGGGTPSLVPAHAIADLLEHVAARFGTAGDAEVTLEANPGPAEIGDLRALRAAGVTRLSIGAQSLQPAELRRIGRRHRPADVVAGVEAARDAGFDSLSVDLLMDIPGQTLDTWDATLVAVTDLAPDHCSTYLLTLEDPDADGLTTPDGDHLPVRAGARRWRATAIAAQDEDRAAEMDARTDARLTSAGYQRYELSNHARPGHESRHNLAYWHRDAVEAVGPGAHAFDGALTRRWNAARIDRYLAALLPGEGSAAHLPPGGTECIDPRTAHAEAAILALRLATGMEVSAMDDPDLGPGLTWAFDAGLLAHVDHRLVLTSRGRLLSNEVFARLLPERPTGVASVGTGP